MDKQHNNDNESAQARVTSRREFLRNAGAGAVGLAVAASTVSASGDGDRLEGTKMAMVIDLQRCTGCGGCVISCKTENNIQAGVTFAKRRSKTVGTFPNVRFEFIPTLCNHCEEAPCVRGCPTGAMHKGHGDITMHTPAKCIGCKTCVAICPYGIPARNSKETHRFWQGKKALIPGCTSSPAELSAKSGTTIPHYNPDKELSAKGAGLRYKGIVEKCTFCDHRVCVGELPFCVVSCPANARVFGDLNDPDSAVNMLLGKYRPWRLKEHLHTEPKVFYIRSFNPGNYPTTKGSI